MKVIHLIKNGLSLIATLLLAFSAYKFLSYNAPIIKGAYLDVALTGISTVLLLINLTAFKAGFNDTGKKVNTLVKALWLLAASAILIIVFLEAVLWDFFQPFSCYDDVIYLSMAGILLYIVRFAIDVFVASSGRLSFVISTLLLFLPASLGLWNKLQQPFDFGVDNQYVTHLFTSGEAGYDIFRIPSLCVIPQGSTLANGDTVRQDKVLAYAEARRNGSLDQGDIDLVQRISGDAGETWSPIEITQIWSEGIGKIGNPTPVFDAETGLLWLFYIAGDGTQEHSYNTFYRSSFDGGNTWGEAQLLDNNTVGPGHGIQIEDGSFKGRLVIPAYNRKGAFTLISDDHGASWKKTDNLGVGNETEVAQADSAGNLIMITRIQIPLSKPHGELQKLICYSKDGGEQWTIPMENTDLRTPICMSSMGRNNGVLYYSYTDQYFNRSNLTVAQSEDAGKTWGKKQVVYPGPSGYSNLDKLSNGDMLVLFENGAVEYDERITLVRLTGKAGS